MRGPKPHSELRGLNSEPLGGKPKPDPYLPIHAQGQNQRSRSDLWNTPPSPSPKAPVSDDPMSLGHGLPASGGCWASSLRPRNPAPCGCGTAHHTRPTASGVRHGGLSLGVVKASPNAAFGADGACSASQESEFYVKEFLAIDEWYDGPRGRAVLRRWIWGEEA